MSKSILSNERRCFFCGNERDLDRHHVFGGTANRKLSEEDGCWVYLCREHHTMSAMSVHMNRHLDLMLKEQCQKKWEEIYGERYDFTRRYGKSYL